MEHKFPPVFVADARRLGDGKVFGSYAEPSTLMDCPNCGGIGSMSAFYAGAAPEQGEWLTVSFVGNRLQPGVRRWQPCPVCQGNAKAAWLERESGLTGDDLSVRLADFRPFPGKEAARESAGSLLAAVPKASGFVTFWGGYGVGKSMLLKALANGYRLAGILAVYVRMSDLLAEARSGFADDAGATEAIINRFRYVRVLALDEIERINPTPWAIETMFRLIDARYNDRGSRLTLIATNADPEKFPPALGYLSSRMTGGQVIQVGGQDVRPAMAKTEGQLP